MLYELVLKLTKILSCVRFFLFVCLAMLVMFNVDLLYIIVMLMLPDGLESCRAHSHMCP